MKNKPTTTELLSAIQDFLMKEVLPSVQENDALSYKTLVSWNMLGLVSREIQTGESVFDSELNRLQDFFSEYYPSRNPLPNEGNFSPENLSTKEKQDLLYKSNHILAEIIRKEKLLPSKSDTKSQALGKHIISTLEEELSISNPRFGS